MTYKINYELAQAVINYLATRPYQEVFQLINAMQQLEKLEDAAKKSEPAPK